jgi:hypothetical protein
VRLRTSAAIVSHSAQSFTSSWSQPQNNSSIPWGLVILQEFSNNRNKMQYSSPHIVHSLIKTTKIDQPLSFCSSILILKRKTRVVRVIHQIQTERPQLLVSKVQNSMEK